MELRWYQEQSVQAMINATGNSVVVLPTGSGKTIVIAEYVKRFQGEILILSHVREILAQNYAALVRHLDGNVHMYSAGWNMRSVGTVTVAGIHSVYKRPDLFQNVSMVLIDECHLINVRNVGMYRKFLDALGVQVIGLTATPFRLGQGYIHIGEESLFDNICIDMSDSIPRLQKEGYLSRLKSKKPEQEMGVDGIHTIAGDFSASDLAERFATTEEMVEIINGLYGYINYKKWLVFCINIKHAEFVADILTMNGVPSGVVHSKLTLAERDKTLNKFATGEIQALVNVNVLTTGFDAPDVDLIVMLRPTKSASLYSQIIGRGLRVAPGKDHCLVLDYAGNIARLGPINNLRIDKEGKLNPGMPAPEKVCKECGMYISLAARVCPECGADLRPDVTQSLDLESSDLELVEAVQPKIKWWDIAQVTYSPHKTNIGKTSVKINYHCGARIFREWLCIGHRGFAGVKAERRLRARWDGDLPLTMAEFLAESGRFQAPTKIMVDTRGKYPEIIDKNYG